MKSNASTKSSVEEPNRQPLDFRDVADWAADDTKILKREMLDVIRQVVGQAGVKAKIAGVLLVRRQLSQMSRLTAALEGDAGIEKVLFDPERLRRMKNSELIELWRAASRLRLDTEKSYINAVLDPDTRLSPDPEDLRSAVKTDEMMLNEQQQEIAAAGRRALGEKLSVLSARAFTKTIGIVTEPPRIM